MTDVSPKRPDPPTAGRTVVAAESPAPDSVQSKFLLEHSQEAMVAAMEVYNKPTIKYRNECTAILLLNSWELVLKALLVLHKQSIFAEARGPARTQARTISWHKAWHNSQPFLPPSLANSATECNLDTLAKYLDHHQPAFCRCQLRHLHYQSSLRILILPSHVLGTGRHPPQRSLIHSGDPGPRLGMWMRRICRTIP